MNTRPPKRRTIIQSFQADTPSMGIPAGQCPTNQRPTNQRPTNLGEAEEGSELPTIGDVLGGCYRLVRKLGEGMFGQVYVAERTDVPEHRVALKVMIKKVYAGRNVDRELVMLAAASHPHIVQLKDHGTSDTLVWLTMPLYQGETLAQRLARKPLTLREAHDIFVPIARGLQSLHDRGLRHQDVKPDNVFLADFGGQLHPMLLDLGVAVEKNATFVAGTALYGAPEQIAALSGMGRLAALSEKVDGYGLASTLLHALVGDQHFPGDEANSPLAVADSFDERETQPLRDGALPELSGAPRRMLNEAFARWLRKDPEERPSAGAIAAELDVLLEQERQAADAIEQAVARQRTSLQRVRWALAGAALIGMVGALYGFSKRETLRLASELEHARARGAASFDKLDTCAAAHRLSQQNVSGCQLARDDEQSAHKRALSGIVRDKERGMSGLSKRLDRSAVRLRSCRDDAQSAREQHQQQQEEWQTATSAQLLAFEGERVSFEKAARERDETLRVCQGAKIASDGQRDSCRGELITMTTASDSCTTQLAALESSAQRCETERASALTAQKSCELEVLSCRAQVGKASNPEQLPTAPPTVTPAATGTAPEPAAKAPPMTPASNTG